MTVPIAFGIGLLVGLPVGFFGAIGIGLAVAAGKPLPRDERKAA